MADSHASAVGGLTRDPELRFGQAGNAIASFTVASSHRYRQGDDWKEETTFVDCVAFGAMAENLAASATKGSRVWVEGRLKQDTWEDKETGAKRSKLVVVCDEVGISLRFNRAEIQRPERTTPRTATKGKEPDYGDEESF